MDAVRFDALARTLTATRSRRAVLPLGLAGLLTSLGVTGAAAGKRGKKRKKRRPAGQLPCVAESAAATCAGRCGTWANNCGLAVACPGCPTGQDCLVNGSCARNCASDPECGGATQCGCSNANLEGQRYCESITAFCRDMPTPCTGTGQCPRGQHCVHCGSQQSDPRCYPLCG